MGVNLPGRHRDRLIPLNNLKPESPLSQEAGMDLDLRAVEATETFLRNSGELNAKFPGAINAGHRMRLLEEKNQLTEHFANELGMSPARPAPLPDFPVFDLRAMDDLITREEELQRLAAIEPPQFSFKSKIGMGIAMGIFCLTVTTITLQVRSFQEDVQPVLTTEEGRRAQVQRLLEAIGDREQIQSATSLRDLENRLVQHRNAIRELSLGGTDEELENELNKRRDLIKNQIRSLRAERK